MIGLGLTAEEVRVVEELGAKLDLNTTQVLRSAIRLYQLRGKGKIVIQHKEHFTGCSSPE